MKEIIKKELLEKCLGYKIATDPYFKSDKIIAWGMIYFRPPDDGGEYEEEIEVYELNKILKDLSLN